MLCSVQLTAYCVLESLTGPAQHAPVHWAPMPQRSCLLQCLAVSGTQPRSAARLGAPRSKIAALAVLLLVLAATDGQQSSAALHLSGRLRTREPSGAAREPPRKHGGRACVINAYVAEYLNYEFPYLFGRVLGGVRARCGCWLRVLPRAQLLRDMHVSRALIVSGTNSDAWPTFAADLASLRRTANLSTLGLVHLGDEHLVDDVAAYARFAFVLRNYVREGLPPGAAVTWFPLGYGHMLLPSAEALRTPASTRSLLWSWSGKQILFFVGGSQPTQDDDLITNGSSDTACSLFALFHMHGIAPAAQL